MNEKSISPFIFYLFYIIKRRKINSKRYESRRWNDERNKKNRGTHAPTQWRAHTKKNSVQKNFRAREKKKKTRRPRKKKKNKKKKEEKKKKNPAPEKKKKKITSQKR